MTEAFKNIDLSLNTNLRTVEIHQLTLYRFAPGNSAVPVESPYSGLNSLLSSAASSRLTDVTLHVWLSEEWHLDWIDWSAMAKVFSAPHHPLRRLIVVVRGLAAERGDVKRWVGARLQNDALSAILAIKFDDQ